MTTEIRQIVRPLDPQAVVEAHVKATTGVHGVGASEVESKAGAQEKVDAHAGRTDNPHNVTATQVGAAPASHVGAGGAAHANVTTSSAGFMSASDKTKLDGISQGAKQVAVWTGQVANGGTIPVPNGWTRGECTVFVSVRDGRAKDTANNWDDTCVKCWVDPSTWVVTVDVFDTDGRVYTASANYLIIGVR
ncbi:MAG: hypothetical protein ACM309_09365 [Bacillota bacterium]